MNNKYLDLSIQDQSRSIVSKVVLFLTLLVEVLVISLIYFLILFDSHPPFSLQKLLSRAENLPSSWHLLAICGITVFLITTIFITACLSYYFSKKLKKLFE